MGVPESAALLPTELAVNAGSGLQHLTSGFLDPACAACGQRQCRLLRLDPVPADLGVTSRENAARGAGTWSCRPAQWPYSKGHALGQ